MRIISLLLFLLLTSIPLIAQQLEPAQYGSSALKISPFGFIRSEFQAGWEYYFQNRKSSVSLIPSVILRESQRSSKFGYQLMGEYRRYLSHINAANHNTLFGFQNYGFYTGLYGLYLDFEEDYIRDYYDNSNGNSYTKEHHKTVNAVEGGLMLGLVVDITSKILIDINVGGGVRKSNVKDDYIPSADSYYYDDSTVFDIDYTGVKPKIGFMIGFNL